MTLSRAPSSGLRTSETQTGISNLFEQEQEHQPGTDYTMSLPGILTVIALVLVVVLLIIL